MNKKTIISMILILTILLIIIVVSLILLNKENINGNNDIKGVTQAQKVSQVKDDNLFFTIENCLLKYESILNLNYEMQVDEFNMPTLAFDYGIQTEEQKKQALINILDKQYIDEKNVNVDNLYNFLNASTDDVNVEALKINKIMDNNQNIETYTVYAKIENLPQNKETFEFYIIKIDTQQETFCIYPLNSSEYKELDDIKVTNNIKEIVKNQNNSYLYMEYSEGQIITKYFQEYKELLLNNPQEAYEKLNTQYKNKRFETFETFEKFIQENIETIQYMQIMQYNVEENGDSKKYVCKDVNQNYYIINEDAPRDYNVILDTYTIDLPEFLKAYNSVDNIKKVGYNIERIKEAMNWKDYEYVYNKLDETYRNNNFNDIEKFKEFINTKFYNRSDIEFLSVSNQGNVYIYSIKIIDADNKNNSNEVNILMQLKEETDFVISFEM